MTIAQISRATGLTPDTLRYYEKIGIIPPVPRKASGVRDYGEKELKWLNFAKHMRKAGLPIESLIEYVALFQRGEETRGARLKLLEGQMEQLLQKRRELEDTISFLDAKIERYQKGLCAKDLQW